MTDIEELTAIVLKFRDERDWKQFHGPKDLAISLMLEAGELLELFQRKNDEEIKEYVRSNKTAIGEELADILYHILIFGHDLDIDIPEAFKKKMEENRAKYPIEKAKGNGAKYTEL